MEKTKQQSSLTLLFCRKAASKLGLNCRGVLTESLMFDVLDMTFLFMAIFQPESVSAACCRGVKQLAYGQNPLAAALTLPFTAKNTVVLIIQISNLVSAVVQYDGYSFQLPKCVWVQVLSCMCIVLKLGYHSTVKYLLLLIQHSVKIIFLECNS